jgi:Flp pilus assembly secretin CpaC
MKRLALAVSLLLAGPALAQPQEEAPGGLISLSVGQAKVFRFDEPFGRVDFMPKETADAIPQSDRQLSIVGIKSGTTHMFVFSSDGRQIFSTDITVAQEPGHLVKIYGTSSRDRVAREGFVATYCDEFGCSRPDQDLPRPAVSVERVIQERR